MSPTSSSLEDQQQQQSQQAPSKEATIKKAKKTETLGLQDQLRPLLNSLDIWHKSSFNVDFDFTLRGVLLESALYVVVFEDIPFNLWSCQGSKSSGATNLASIKKIQQFFLSSINENFRCFDNDLNGSSNATHMHHLFHGHQHQSHYNQNYYPNSTRSSQQFHSSNQSEEQIKTYDVLVDGMKNDVKNAIVLKLNDIKSGDLIVKQIIDNLRRSETVNYSFNDY